MYFMSTNLSTLGSRYSLVFDTGNHRVKHGPFGMFLEQKSSLVCGVEADGINGSYLPFCEKDNNFLAVYQSSTMNSVIYKAINKEGGYNMTATFTSPFCPENDKMNTAPIFYVNVKVERNTRPHNLVKVKKNIDKGAVVFGLSSNELTLKANGRSCDVSYTLVPGKEIILGDFARSLSLLITQNGQSVEAIDCKERITSFNADCDADGFFRVPFDLSVSDVFECDFMLCTYLELKDFITIYETPHNLLYTANFKNLDDVENYGIEKHKEIMLSSSLMDSTIAESSLSQSWKDFIAFTFQSYKMNTIYSCDEFGNRAYNIWEGNCMYNSTMDVEYNNGLFYYTYFTDIMPLLLKQWADTEKGEGYIDHDLGKGYTVSKADYSYPMIIEENCNFMQMLFAHCTMKGSFEEAQKHYSVMQKLVKYIYDADTTGNGIPNKGTDNTIDDAVPSIQNAKEQTYLAIKSACTLQCFAKMASALGHEDEAQVALLRSEKIIGSVDRELWCDDHYGVCTDTSQDGYWRFLTHETLSGPMEGKDSYSIYAENGLLYPMMSGLSPKFLDYERLGQNISVSAVKCMTDYGCNHSHDSDSIWFSQNMWRDFTAAYLGYDMLDNVDRYWEFQKIMNTGDKLNLYIDTFGENALFHYPRGLTSVGVIFAMLRLKIDGFKKEIRINPIRNNMRIPLVMFADWKKGIIPWVNVELGATSIENAELLCDYNIIIG